jgi:hypothetical protein
MRPYTAACLIKSSCLIRPALYLIAARKLDGWRLAMSAFFLSRFALATYSLAWPASSSSQQSAALCPRLPQTVHTGIGFLSTGAPLRARLAPDVSPRS